MEEPREKIVYRRNSLDPLNKDTRKKASLVGIDGIAKKNKVDHISMGMKDSVVDVKDMPLLPIDYQILNFLMIGSSRAEACKKFGRSDHYIKHLMKKSAAGDYLRYVVNEHKKECFAQKNDIVRDLVFRLQSASNRDAVGIIKILSELMGWVKPLEAGNSNVDINIQWSDNELNEKKVIEVPEGIKIKQDIIGDNASMMIENGDFEEVEVGRSLPEASLEEESLTNTQINNIGIWKESSNGADVDDNSEFRDFGNFDVDDSLDVEEDN